MYSYGYYNLRGIKIMFFKQLLKEEGIILKQKKKKLLRIEELFGNIIKGCYMEEGLDLFYILF